MPRSWRDGAAATANFDTTPPSLIPWFTTSPLGWLSARGGGVMFVSIECQAYAPPPSGKLAGRRRASHRHLQGIRSCLPTRLRSNNRGIQRKHRPGQAAGAQFRRRRKLRDSHAYLYSGGVFFCGNPTLILGFPLADILRTVTVHPSSICQLELPFSNLACEGRQCVEDIERA